MIWFLFSILSALFWVAQAGLIKGLKNTVPEKIIGWSIVSLECLLVLPLLLYEGIPEIKSEFYLGLFISLAINLFAVDIYIKGLQLSPLSVAFPLLSFTPLFMTLPGYIMLKEIPSIKGILGIVAIVIGTSFLEIGKVEKGLFSPFKAIFKDKGARAMLLVAFLWSISAIGDKMATINSSPSFYLVSFCFIFSIIYLPLAKRSVKNFKNEVLINKKYLFILGLFGTLMMLFQLFAMRISQASYVIAIKRSGMLFAAFTGMFFFKEKFGIRRFIGIVFMILGLFLLAISEK